MNSLARNAFALLRVHPHPEQKCLVLNPTASFHLSRGTPNQNLLTRPGYFRDSFVPFWPRACNLRWDWNEWIMSVEIGPTTDGARCRVLKTAHPGASARWCHCRRRIPPPRCPDVRQSGPKNGSLNRRAWVEGGGGIINFELIMHGDGAIRNRIPDDGWIIQSWGRPALLRGVSNTNPRLVGRRGVDDNHYDEWWFDFIIYASSD